MRIQRINFLGVKKKIAEVKQTPKTELELVKPVVDCQVIPQGIYV